MPSAVVSWEVTPVQPDPVQKKPSERRTRRRRISATEPPLPSGWSFESPDSVGSAETVDATTGSRTVVSGGFTS
ncbi:MAG: hypothetical protein M0D55_01645 [Elusimicrobiota bacterium]|nr:MAG: hypothetical protein M0D55_01645 [Elusimicrobiota bacterium]